MLLKSMNVSIMVITYSKKSKDQPGKVANPARGQLNRAKKKSLSPFAPKIWSRETSPAVPSRVSLLIYLHTQAESSAYLRDSSRCPQPTAPIYYLNRHTPLGQPRVYRVTQLRTDAVHCRESAGTGPVNLTVVLNGCCLGRSP